MCGGGGKCGVWEPASLRAGKELESKARGACACCAPMHRRVRTHTCALMAVRLGPPLWHGLPRANLRRTMPSLPPPPWCLLPPAPASDTFHKPGFKLQARILHHLFTIVQVGQGGEGERVCVCVQEGVQVCM